MELKKRISLILIVLFILIFSSFNTSASSGMKGDFPGRGIHVAGVSAGVIALGGISKKPGVVGDKIRIREYLHMTIAVNHDLIDGSPLVRFVEKLNELIENAAFLE